MNAGATTWGSKADIANRLAALNGWRRYLEICTSATGLHHAELDRRQFTTCHRLMSFCPAGYDDGLPVEFRSADHGIAECVREIKARGLRYDVILVDPWHEYETSRRALEAGIELLDAHGIMIVHDCLPRTKRLASPTFRDGIWSGVTYEAYLDFVLAHPELTYYTVDTDLGCGLVRRAPARGALSGVVAAAERAMRRSPAWTRLGPRMGYDRIVRAWRRRDRDHAATFVFFQGHFAPLLRLRTFAEFLEIEQAVARGAGA